MEQRSFQGIWIPKEVWLDDNLGWSEKLLLVEINSLDNERGCFATNEYFSNFFNLSISRISKIVSGLVAKGYLEINIIHNFEKTGSTKRVLKSAIGYRRKVTEGIAQNSDRGIGEKCSYNNTVINNTINNTKDTISLIFEYYQNKGIIKHRSLSDSMKKALTKFFKTYTKEDAELIIDRHFKVVELTKASKYPVKPRALNTLFAQKITNDAGSPYIYEEYLEGGAKYESYIKGTESSVPVADNEEISSAPRRRSDF